MVLENWTRWRNLSDVDDMNAKQSTPIDPSFLKFALALFIVSILVEIVGSVSQSAAWGLVVIIVLGLLLNNPLAIGLISLGGTALRRGVS